jgi:hypothetical protein
MAARWYAWLQREAREAWDEVVDELWDRDDDDDDMSLPALVLATVVLAALVTLSLAWRTRATAAKDVEPGVRCAIISGAASGIGAALTARLADDGYFVLALDSASSSPRARAHDSARSTPPLRPSPQPTRMASRGSANPSTDAGETQSWPPRATFATRSRSSALSTPTLPHKVHVALARLRAAAHRNDSTHAQTQSSTAPPWRQKDASRTCRFGRTWLHWM